MNLDALIPVLGILFVMGPIGAWVFSYSPLGRAIVNRLNGRVGPASGSDTRILELQEDIERLHELAAQQDARFDELSERLDFAERMLLSANPPRPTEEERESTPV